MKSRTVRISVGEVTIQARIDCIDRWDSKSVVNNSIDGPKYLVFIA